MVHGLVSSVQVQGTVYLSGRIVEEMSRDLNEIQDEDNGRNQTNEGERVREREKMRGLEPDVVLPFLRERLRWVSNNAPIPFASLIPGAVEIDVCATRNPSTRSPRPCFLRTTSKWKGCGRMSIFTRHNEAAAPAPPVAPDLHAEPAPPTLGICTNRNEDTPSLCNGTLCPHTISAPTLPILMVAGGIEVKDGKRTRDLTHRAPDHASVKEWRERSTRGGDNRALEYRCRAILGSPTRPDATHDHLYLRLLLAVSHQRLPFSTYAPATKTSPSAAPRTTDKCERRLFEFVDRICSWTLEVRYLHRHYSFEVKSAIRTTAKPDFYVEREVPDASSASLPRVASDGRMAWVTDVIVYPYPPATAPPHALRIWILDPTLHPPATQPVLLSLVLLPLRRTTPGPSLTYGIFYVVAAYGVACPTDVFSKYSTRYAPTSKAWSYRASYFLHKAARVLVILIPTLASYYRPSIDPKWRGKKGALEEREEGEGGRELKRNKEGTRKERAYALRSSSRRNRQRTRPEKSCSAGEASNRQFTLHVQVSEWGSPAGEPCLVEDNEREREFAMGGDRWSQYSRVEARELSMTVNKQKPTEALEPVVGRRVLASESTTHERAGEGTGNTGRDERECRMQSMTDGSVSEVRLTSKSATGYDRARCSACQVSSVIRESHESTPCQVGLSGIRERASIFTIAERPPIDGSWFMFMFPRVAIKRVRLKDEVSNSRRDGIEHGLPGFVLVSPVVGRRVLASEATTHECGKLQTRRERVKRASEQGRVRRMDRSMAELNSHGYGIMSVESVVKKQGSTEALKRLIANPPQAMIEHGTWCVECQSRYEKAFQHLLVGMVALIRRPRAYKGDADHGEVRNKERNVIRSLRHEGGRDGWAGGWKASASASSRYYGLTVIDFGLEWLRDFVFGSGRSRKRIAVKVVYVLSVHDSVTAPPKFVTSSGKCKDWTGSTGDAREKIYMSKRREPRLAQGVCPARKRDRRLNRMEMENWDMEEKERVPESI
ncbi:hypothetical protein BC629DRAFT_1445634 [Irpex lacteus]|nr:hypothetical protein BC629DRAFT_1445634 [Irpex lacteus]